MSSSIHGPFPNSPHEQPDQHHYEIGPHGPTGLIGDGHRPSESFTPIAVTEEGTGAKGEQQALGVDATGERRQQQHTLINGIRRYFARWRMSSEPAIFLTDVAGRNRHMDCRKQPGPENVVHKAGPPRAALNMATGSSKPVVTRGRLYVYAVGHQELSSSQDVKRARRVAARPGEGPRHWTGTSEH